MGIAFHGGSMWRRSLHRGHVVAAWMIACGSNGCKERIVVSGELASVEAEARRQKWIETVQFGWLCPYHLDKGPKR
jgi:hypothetical protein